MNRLRNWTLTILTALALLAPLSIPSNADANPQPSPPHNQQRVYWVYYRSCADSPWVCYGGYYHLSQAVQAVNYYRYYGYDAYYR